MKRTLKTILLATLPLLAVAEPVTSDEAARAVETWIGLGPQLGCRLGASVAGARTCVPTNGVSFHVVTLAGGGFVVTSSDTEIEPIIAFSGSDDLVESERNPLWTLLRKDLSHRTACRRQAHAAAAAGTTAVAQSTAAAKWARLLPVKATNGLARALHAASGKKAVSDIRVAPLLETKWSQMQDVYYSDKGSPCYNYYTPNNYPCGCVATVGAQIMRYHCFPSEAVTPETYPCSLSGTSLNLTMQGGVYAWSSMPTVPAVGTTEEQRKAIGKLTSDVGISCCMNYGSDGSSAFSFMLANSLVERFGYASAHVAISDSFAAEEIRRALVSNLDAKLPVMLGLQKGSGNVGHAVVADGYGFSLSTFYAHVNLGWGGVDDAWYAPPDIGEYDAISTVIYNIFPKREMKGQLSDYPTNGVICSGRILSSSGAPVRGTGVWAKSDESGRSELVTTDEKGIYAFILPPGTYTISSGSVLSGAASRTVTLKENVSTLLVSEINNVIDNDLTVIDEPLFAVHTVAFDLGAFGMRTGGGTLTQFVIDGKSATAPELAVADGWKFTGWSDDFSAVTSDLTVLAQYKEEGGGGGGGGEVTNAVKAGKWTTDVEGVKAAKDLRMAIILFANYAGCWWSQHEQATFEAPEFLEWAEKNGIYLVTVDRSRLPEGCSDCEEACHWFTTLTSGVCVPSPCIAIVGLADLDRAISVDVVRSDGLRNVGGVYYDGSYQRLATGLAVYLDQLDTLRRTLTGVSIAGKESVVSESSETYECLGSFKDGSVKPVAANWEIVSGAEYSSITNGEFTATLPASAGGRPRTSVIKATYTSGSVTKTASLAVTIQPLTTLVSFDANGGTGTVADVTATYGAAMPPLSEMPTRAGHRFLGYFDAADGGANYYTETLSSAQAWNKKEEKAVLYAHWKEKYTSPWWADPLTGVEWVYESVTNGVAITDVSQETGVLLLPDRVADQPVVALADGALANKALSVVIVPTNIASIGVNAFSNDTALTRIDFEGLPPDGLAGAGIPTNALVRYNDACSNDWQAALTNGALANVNVRSYHPLVGDVWECEECGDGVRVVGQKGGGDAGPVDVRLPQTCGGKTVRAIGMNAFANATTVVLPASVWYWERDPFDRSPDLTSIDVIGGGLRLASVGGVLYDRNVETLCLCPQAAASVTVPPTVRTIARAAFRGCRRIGTLHLPATVTQIEAPVFCGCASLTNLTVDARSQSYCVRDGVLYDAARTTLVGCLVTCRNAAPPQTVRRIGDWGFCGCANLAEAVLPAGLREIGVGVFSNATALVSVELPSGVRGIPDGAFAFCSNLTSVVFLGAVTNIGAGAFSSCESLTDLTVPASVTCLGRRAFAGCPSLELSFKGTPPSCGEDAVRFCRCGSYTTQRAAWQRVIGDDGKWNGLAMVDRSCLVAFADEKATAAAGGAFVLVVKGGNDRAASSVKVEVAYVNAEASDLLLRDATVSGVGKKGVAFPLTLKWEAGDTSPKTVTIPVASGKASDAPKYLTWNLTNRKELEPGETLHCIGMIAAGAGWDKEDVCVLPFADDATGGKVSGGASVRPDARGAFKPVTLKASPSRGYWFAGWYGTNGVWTSGSLACTVTPVAGSGLTCFEARFVPAKTALAATYSGYACVNLKGMALVKGAPTSADVIGDYPLTVTLATSGKVSGAVTVGGKKVPFAADGCCALSNASVAASEPGEDRATFRCLLDEKAWFGSANDETLQLEIVRRTVGGVLVDCGTVRQTGASDLRRGAYAPLGDGTNGVACRVTDKANLERLLPFAGSYAVAFEIEGGVLPLSVAVDKSGNVKATGRYVDGTSLTLSGKLCYNGTTAGEKSCTEASVSLFATPKALGAGALHVDLRFGHAPSSGRDVRNAWCMVTHYTAAKVATFDADRAVGGPYDSGCWYPRGTDPDGCVVRLTSGEESVDICYVAKNGAITGLAAQTATGETVKFDAKTGLLVVTKSRAYTIQGVLGDYASGCYAAGRINADGTRQPVTVAFVKLPTPEESIPWTSDAFVLSLGQKYAEGLQPSVTSGGQTLALTVTGLPAGLKFDKETGLITGAPTKAGTFAVKVSYRYGPQTIVRETTFVVSPKPEDLPSGTYAGRVMVRCAGGQETAWDVCCPATLSFDRNGALSGSVTVAGRKTPLKAVGYDACSAGDVLYDNVALDLSALDVSWGEVALALSVSAEDLIGSNDPAAAGGLDVAVGAWPSEARFWIDDSVDPDTTCLEVTCDADIFPAAQFAWTTKTVAGEKLVAGVGKTVNGSALTFRIEDKTGIFSGAYGTYKVDGSMEKGMCTGDGTLVGKDGTIVGTVRVRVVERK